MDAAGPGDLVLIEPGIYHESVVVQTPEIVIRGVDRNTVILDGEFDDDMENGVIVVADGVAIENLTVRNYRNNGLFWTGSYDDDIFVEGYRASYVTVHSVGTYGLYAFNATDGQFDHSYAAGSDSSAFYVGQCDPCNALLYDVVGEYSGLGYSGTNSTGVTIAASEFRHNAIGVLPNSSDFEELAPNAGTTIVGNHIHDNNAFIDTVPVAERVGLGTGVVLGGTLDNVVERNRITANPGGGVVVIDWLPELDGDTFYPSRDNVVRDNVVRDNVVEGDGTVELVLALSDPSEGAQGNCFGGNQATSSAPAAIDEVLACGAEPGGEPIDLETWLGPSGLIWAVVDPTTAPVPELDFASMPDAATAPPRPAVDVPMAIDVDAITVPPGD